MSRKSGTNKATPDSHRSAPDHPAKGADTNNTDAGRPRDSGSRVKRQKVKAEDRHEDPAKKIQAKNGRLANLRGKSAERALVKTIAQWWDPDLVFEWRRTPGSGGSPLKSGFDLAGDITTTDKSFPFHIEAKKDMRWGKLDCALTTSKWVFWKFIEQAEDDCPKHRYPILIFMTPGPSQPRFVAFWRLPPHVYMLLGQLGLTYIQLHATHERYSEVIVMTLDEFVKIPPARAMDHFKS